MRQRCVLLQQILLPSYLYYVINLCRDIPQLLCPEYCCDTADTVAIVQHFLLLAKFVVVIIFKSNLFLFLPFLLLLSKFMQNINLGEDSIFLH